MVYGEGGGGTKCVGMGVVGGGGGSTVCFWR